MNRIQLWMEAMRAPFFLASALSATLGTGAAAFLGYRIDWLAGVLTLVGLVAVHAGANLANDYFDHTSGNDWSGPKRSPFSGGSRMIQRGILTARAVLAASLISFAFGGALGLVVAVRARSWEIIALGFAGCALSLFYTAPPLRFAYRGLGELTIGTTFGPLPTLGAYLAQGHGFSWYPVFIGIPAGLLVAMILFANEFTDIEMDSAVGKRNLVVRLGARLASKIYVAGGLGVSVSLVCLCLAGLMPASGLAALAATPVFFVVGKKLASNELPSLISASGLHILTHHMVTAWLTIAFFTGRLSK